MPFCNLVIMYLFRMIMQARFLSHHGAIFCEIFVTLMGMTFPNLNLIFPDDSSILSLTLEFYSSNFAMKEVKSHVLSVIHNHLGALPWHHLHPSLQDTMIFSRVVKP